MSQLIERKELCIHVLPEMSVLQAHQTLCRSEEELNKRARKAHQHWMQVLIEHLQKAHNDEECPMDCLDELEALKKRLKKYWRGKVHSVLASSKLSTVSRGAAYTDAAKKFHTGSLQFGLNGYPVFGCLTNYRCTSAQIEASVDAWSSCFVDTPHSVI